APAGRGRRENRGRPRAGHAPGAHPEDGAATAEEDSSQGCRGGEPWRATGYRSRREPPGLVEEAGRGTPVEVTGSGSPPRNTSLARVRRGAGRRPRAVVVSIQAALKGDARREKGQGRALRGRCSRGGAGWAARRGPDSCRGSGVGTAHS